MIRLDTFSEAAITPGSILEQMYRARTAVFRDRLNWQVKVDDGLEIDHYDRYEDPLYVLDVEDGEVVGSLRLLPTTGRTMLKNEFAGMFDEPVDFESETAWECTRFCIHPNAKNFQKTSGDLAIGACELALQSGIEHIVGLYDARMTRVYRKIGWSPSELTRSDWMGETLIVGIWDVTEAALANIRERDAQMRGARAA